MPLSFIVVAMVLAGAAVVARAAPSPAVGDNPAPTSYADAVCKPDTVHPSDPLPPCVEIENIETLCWPNGTAPLYLAAHAQCMCRGSFFPEWNACRSCLSVHGQLSDRDRAFYESVATAASTSLCGFLTSGGPVTTTPTAIFRDLFTSAEASQATPTTGATTPGTDEARSDTDVSLYFTASGPQGPGSITGSATAATATGLVVATGHPPKVPGPAATPPASGPSATATAPPPSSTETGGGSSQSGVAHSSANRMMTPSRQSMPLLFAVMAVVVSVAMVGSLLV